MSDIPYELCREIMYRLPVVPLLRFRCVCKAWRDMIDDPAFTKFHLDRQLLNIHHPSNGVDQLIVRDDKDGLCFVPVDSLINYSDQKTEPMPLHHNPWKPSICTNFCYRALSCNGVMFLSHYGHYIVSSILWNPSTGESHKLPAHSTISIMRSGRKPAHVYVNTGFGYDSTSDDYKVVNFTQFQYHCGGGDGIPSFELETMVYSLRSNSWRRIKNFPYLITSWRCGVFLSGALHWITNTKDLIVGIDLGSEDYFQMPLPHPELSFQPDHRNMQLNVLGGCLAISCFNPLDMVLDVWLMNDYKVENSWNKLFSITGSEYMDFWPAVYCQSRGVVVLENQKICTGSWPKIYSRSPEFLRLDLETRSTKKITVDGALSINHCSRFHFHLDSLVRLNHVTIKGRKRPREEFNSACTP